MSEILYPTKFVIEPIFVANYSGSYASLLIKTFFWYFFYNDKLQYQIELVLNYNF